MSSLQQDLVDRLRAEFEPQDRFRGLWLTGSLGNGTADRFSDVDTLLVVRPTDLEAVLDGWSGLAAEIGDIVYLKRLGDAPVFNHVLAGWLRWDIVITPPENAHLVRGSVRPVFDTDGLPAVDLAPREVDRGAALAVTEEFLRCLGLLPVVAGRDDAVGAQLGAGLLRQQLVVLLRLRAEAGMPEGALHLRRTLPPADYELIAGLPAPAATIAATVHAHRALTDAFLPVARRMLGDAYPDRLAEACLAHLDEGLGQGWGVH